MGGAGEWLNTTANVGSTALVLIALAWVIIRDSRRDKASVNAQADETALALLKEHREERREMRDEMNDLRERLAVMESRERDQAAVLQIHAAWDHKVIEAIKRLDPTLDLGNAPPLYPPHHLDRIGQLRR